MKMYYRIILLLILLTVSTSCRNEEIPSNEEMLSPEAQLTATIESLIAREQGGIRFMTYNVLGGAGGSIAGRERIDILISIIQTYDPDVVGIQEANGWSNNDYSTTKRVATALGMNYSYCKSANGDFDNVIFTKFEIIDSEAFTKVGHCLGRIDVELPNGQITQIFNVHSPHEYCQDVFTQIVELTKPYMDGYAVLLGDFNVVNPGWVRAGESAHPKMKGCPEKLEAAGWTWLGGPTIEASIDQIWVTPALVDFAYFPMIRRQMRLVHHTDLSFVSDHNPVAVDIYIP
jgi:endonuclease/exonuclease/phosphatase family metal-dependent hydrolase